MAKAKAPAKKTPVDNKIQQTKKRLLEALEKSLGVVITACKSAGVDRGTFYQYYNKDEAFRQAVDELENIALDFAESQLHKQIAGGNPTSTIFYLKTKGKKRGYIERIETEVGNKDGEAFKTQNVTLEAWEKRAAERLKAASESLKDFETE